MKRLAQRDEGAARCLRQDGRREDRLRKPALDSRHPHQLCGAAGYRLDRRDRTRNDGVARAVVADYRRVC